ncbi:formin-like, partial [Plectropomus leopardus]|uniref:formin-like n=1 Tax=Plectropomus leopardus TaxID=160734 RepID=UPI001C4D5B29
MEEHKAILKFFRNLSEEENGDIIQGDTELSFNHVKKNGDMSSEETLKNSRDFLSHAISPHVGENTTPNSEGYIPWREAGNDSDMTEEERNNVNLREQQSVAANAENGSEKQMFATNQEQNKTPNENCDKGNGCSKEDCHISENLLHESELNESVQPRCQLIANDSANTGSDCVAPVSVEQDDTEDANQRERKEENVHSQEDFISSTYSLDFDPEESAESASFKPKHAEMTVTRTGPAVEDEPTPALEEAFSPSCIQNEEKNDAEEDSYDEEEKRDVFPDFSAQSHHPSIPKDENIFITSAANNPPPGSTLTRATFSPGSSTDKQIQLPALFSGLRVLRKGVVGPEHDTVAQIKPSSQGARRDIFPERQGDAKVQGGFLGQISQFLNREKRDEKEERKEAEGEQDETDEIEEGQEGDRKEPETEEEVSTESTKPSVSSAEAAFDAFKAFFTPKPLKKDPAEKVDLEAVRKKIRADKDVLRALFERTNKTPEKKDSADGKSEASTPAEGEERTPGRLQAVWPPLKEEKVGLKYTEA